MKASHVTEGGHPSIEQLVDYQNQDTEAAESIQEHVTTCSDCAQVLIDLATFEGEDQDDDDLRSRREAGLAARSVIAEHKRRRWVFATSVAASLALACLGVVTFRELSFRDRPHRYAGLNVPKGIANLPLVGLYPTGSNRAGEVTARLEIPGDAVAVGLILGTSKVTHYRDYRLAIRDTSGREIKAANGIEQAEDGSFRILLPAEDFATGLYRVVLSGVGDREEPVDEYLLEVVHLK